MALQLMLAFGFVFVVLFAQPGVAAVKKEDARELYFRPEDNGVTVTFPQLQWEMTGNDIRIGNLQILGDKIVPSLTSYPNSQVPFRYRFLRSDKPYNVVSFHWPTQLSKDGRLVLYTPDGKKVWASAVTSADVSSWQELIESQKQWLKDHKDTSLGVLNWTPGKEFDFPTAKNLRLCFESFLSDNEQLRVCSPRFEYANGKLEIKSENVGSNVFISGGKAGPRAILTFPADRTLQLRIQFSNGAFVSVKGKPVWLKLVDIFKDDDKNLHIKGYGSKPDLPVEVVQNVPKHFWAETGVERKEIWAFRVPLDKPVIPIQGSFGLQFNTLLRFETVPNKGDRIFVEGRSAESTYDRRPVIFGFSPGSTGMLSRQTSAKFQLDTREVRWTLLAPDKDKINTSYIESRGANGTVKSYYEIYRGFSTEMSLRITSWIKADLKSFFLGEVAASHWFETLGAWQNYYVSKQRWGLSAKYFKSLSPIPVASDEDAIKQNLSSYTIDLKYNFLPGVWNRDELLGLIVSNHKIGMGDINSNLLGVGGYWARTMPKIFDDLFNLLPFFRFPKYVDLDGIYYFATTSPGQKIGTNFHINFHGKVFWTRRLYGEAGFGFKSYQIQTSENVLELSLGYGTVGLGYVF